MQGINAWPCMRRCDLELIDTAPTPRVCMSDNDGLEGFLFYRGGLRSDNEIRNGDGVGEDARGLSDR
nr:unnamed protein product [Digitaria exilis]